MEQNDATAYQDALQEARRRHNEPAVKQLESIAPYSNTDGEKGAIARHWEGELLGPPPGARFIDGRRILLDLVSAPDYSLLDDYGFIRGQSLSLEIFLPQLAQVNLTQLGVDFRVPVFFFEGRQDPYCRPSLVWDYFQAIQAPHKEFVWFDHSGHFPFFEDKQKFVDELVQKVLPLSN
jgi:pimeloyl-ACP methyl ester carboxylesterase